jgi:hypothetical protein
LKSCCFEDVWAILRIPFAVLAVYSVEAAVGNRRRSSALVQPI